MTDKKKIALFISSLCGGGAERVVSRISKELNKEYDLYIFLFEGRKRFYECAGTVIDLGCGSKRYMVNAAHAFLYINKAIREYGVDCVISFLDVPHIINCLRSRGAIKMISIRAYVAAELCTTWGSKMKFFLKKRCFKKADKVISVSEELSAEMVKCFQLDETKAVVIENPYDIAEIREASNTCIDDKVQSFIKNHKTAVTVGRLDWEKGYRELIDVFSMVYAEDKDAALIILGEGEIKEGLEDLIQERHLEERVLLLGLCENPFAYMSKCQLFVSCSRHEGFPNALVEAMACGLPVIHTDCKTGPREIIVGEQMECDIKEALYSSYGVLVPSYMRKNVSKEVMEKEFADAWIRLLSSDELRDQYSHASIERAGYYSMDRCIKKYREVIG